MDRSSALRELSSRLSPILFRELLDCIAGARVTRFDIPTGSVNRAVKWARILDIQFEFGNEYYRMAIDPGMTNWSSTARLVDADAENAFLSMYLSTDEDEAERARRADEADDHETLGKLMSIPKCCRNSYINWAADQDHYVDPISSVEIPKLTNKIPVFLIPNPFACYGRGGLISHYPCSVECEPSMRYAMESLSRIDENWPQVSSKLLNIDTSLALYVKGEGVALAEKYYMENDRIKFDPSALHGQGPVFEYFQNSESITKEGSKVLLYNGENVVFESTRQEYLCAAFRMNDNMY